MTDLDTIRSLQKDLALCKARAADFEHSFKCCERQHHELVIENARLKVSLSEAVSHSRNGQTIQKIREEWGL